MRPILHPRLINSRFEDPVLFMPFLFEKRAMIFDMGDISSLSPRDMLKISHIFISHTHMDHFADFDRLLRLLIGREKKLYIYGPEGFLKNIEGKLAGYTWNLVNNFNNHFVLHATEVHTDKMLTNQYRCKDRFIPVEKCVTCPFNGTLLDESSLTVSAAILDHSIPCLGFSTKERFHINIKKESVLKLGLEPGPWLSEFKEALFNNINSESEFEIKPVKGNTKTGKFVLKDLAKKIALITPGQKVTYITDVVYSESNVKKITELAQGSNILFIEAAFLEKDADSARKKYHLTANQAGIIAKIAGVKQFALFHFSPRYSGYEQFFEKEAQAGYHAASKTLSSGLFTT